MKNALKIKIYVSDHSDMGLTQKHPVKQHHTYSFQTRDFEHSPGSFPFISLPVQRSLVGTIFHLSENQQPGPHEALNPSNVHTEMSPAARPVHCQHSAALNFLLLITHEEAKPHSI